MAASDPGVSVRAHLRAGQVIPAHPLALTAERRLDERRQRALTRYYIDAGAGGVAVGVHTTQFEIRNPEVGLYRPVLELAAETIAQELAVRPRPFVKVAGVVGPTAQAVREAEIASALGYDVALVSLGGLGDLPDDVLVAHCAAIGEVMPIFGFYLQPAVGGRELGYRFWRELAEVSTLWAVKIAPFDRYRTLDVVHAIADAGRDDVALYTGNDDNIVVDLLTPFPVRGAGREGVRWIDGGLLGQWAVWTERAVAMLERIKAVRGASIDSAWLHEAAALTDANAAVFDAANRFRGCIPGIHEVLRRQGLLAGTWCLDPHELLSPGQADELERVTASYPFLQDDAFVRENLGRWME